MLTSTRAIVLHTTNYADQRLIVELLTENEGHQAFVHRISTTRRGVASRTAFQPLSLLDVTYDDRPSQNLKKLNRIQAHPFQSILYDPVKSTIILFLSEFLRAAVKGEPSSPLLFDYIYKSIEWFDACEKGLSNFHLVFLLRLTRFFGFAPNADDYRPGHIFDLLNGAFASQQPMHHHYVAADLAQHLPTLLRMDFSTLHLFRFNGEQRSQLLDIIAEFYRLHIPNFPPLKSLKVLKEVFCT